MADEVQYPLLDKRNFEIVSTKCFNCGSSILYVSWSNLRDILGDTEYNEFMVWLDANLKVLIDGGVHPKELERYLAEILISE